MRESNLSFLPLKKCSYFVALNNTGSTVDLRYGLKNMKFSTSNISLHLLFCNSKRYEVDVLQIGCGLCHRCLVRRQGCSIRLVHIYDNSLYNVKVPMKTFVRSKACHQCGFESTWGSNRNGACPSFFGPIIFFLKLVVTVINIMLSSV